MHVLVGEMKHHLRFVLYCLFVMCRVQLDCSLNTCAYQVKIVM